MVCNVTYSHKVDGLEFSMVSAVLAYDMLCSSNGFTGQVDVSAIIDDEYPDLTGYVIRFDFSKFPCPASSFEIFECLIPSGCISKVENWWAEISYTVFMGARNARK